MSPFPPSPSAPSHSYSAPSHSFPAPSHPVPPSCDVPQFAPVRVKGGWCPLLRLVRNRQRAVALGLAVTAVALVAAGPVGPGDSDLAPTRGHPDGAARSRTHARAHSAAGEPVRRRPASGPAKVTAPVRIADAATVRLLRPGDRVDVIAVPAPGPTAAGGEARVVARGVRVTKVPEPRDSSMDAGDGGSDGGALVVLSVSRSTATRMAGASASALLAVTVW
ncbi:RcpC/CpaB family pilus assembly protein [Streptomyces sp. T028]|uniref:RcpC/CpaB family pilus assembly protein n=1 Tax=Streptomyces sp. T028 TaxID=3394379 RepID=UPI003A8A9679